jgi:hypothetical protein
MTTITIIDGRDTQGLVAKVTAMLADGPVRVKLSPASKRSLQANKLMWVKLNELERTRKWHGRKLAASNWKHLITAGMEQKVVVPNIAGDGFVVLGKATSNMAVKQMNNVIEMADFLLAELA